MAGAVLVAAAAAGLVVALLPNHHGGIASPSKTGAAQTTTTEHVGGGSRGRLSSVWILVPVGLLSLIVIIPLAVFTRQWWSDRRVQRRYRGQLSKELPPLPRPGNPKRNPN